MEASALKFVKIKTDGQKVHLLWETGDKDLRIRHEIENEKSPPHPDFPKALQAMVGWVLDALELPLPYGSTLTVVGLSLSEDSTGRLGLIITAVKRLEKHDGTVVLNTPLIRRPLQDENPEDMPDTWLLFDDNLRKYLLLCQEQAEMYVTGRREQGDLFAKTEPQKAGV